MSILQKTFLVVYALAAISPIYAIVFIIEAM